MSNDPYCRVCRIQYRRAEFEQFCGIDCREDYFSALGAGDTRHTTINLDAPFIGGN